MGATKHYTLLAYDQNCLDEVTIRVQGQLPPGAVMSAQTKGSSPVQVCRKYLCAPPCVRACFRDPAGGCALAWFCVCAHARDRVIREVMQARVRVWIIAYIETRCNAVCTPPKNAPTTTVHPGVGDAGGGQDDGVAGAAKLRRQRDGDLLQRQ